MKILISVCICTYNRATSLARTLESLTQQAKIEGLSWELLLIDNNSNDNTYEVAKSFEQRLPLRYLFEPVQGLSAARNRALSEFKGDLLIFTDDDVIVDPLWLSSYARVEKAFPDADYFGGRILPLWDDTRPKWLVDPSLALISGLLGHYDLGDERHWFEPDDPLPFGANFALRRSLVEGLDPFRLDLGVCGGSLGRGEEAEYLGRAVENRARGVYLPEALCLHTQDANRFRLSHLYHFGVEKGRAAARMGTNSKGGVLPQMRFALRGLGQLMKGHGDRFRQCIINMGIQRGFALERRRLHLLKQK